MQKKRDMGIDIIKCLAIFSVIGVHFILNTINSISINTNFDILIFLAYRQLFIVCVPLFILTTGYLNINKVPSINHYKKIFSILWIYLFYSVLTIIFRNLFMEDSISFIAGIRMIFSFEAIPYAWYVNMFIGLYLLIPYLNKIIKASSKIEFKLFLLIIIVISIIPSTWNNFSTFLGYTNIFPLPNFWNTIYPIAYYMLGGYIKLNPFSIEKKNYIYIGLSIYIVSIIINFAYSSVGNISNVIKDYSSLFILIQSCCLFIYLLDKDIKIFKIFESFIIKIASCTLEIYLISYIVDNIIYKFFKFYLFSNTIKDYVYAIPIILSVFLFSIMIVFFLKSLYKIIVNKIAILRNSYFIK